MEKKMLNPKRPFKTSNRNGAALIIALVLLLFVSALSAVILRQLYNGRLETQRQLLYVETDLLIRDMRERAEQRRAADPSFTGESVTFKELSPHLNGTFQLTTHAEKEITIDAVYRDESGTVIYAITK
ncbi:MAG: hypothetical protein LBT05_08780 [Planctomycetaceae bacterium]|jgi:hypothetical protein|nr:hypothetical protein [Planctomycetaceae bacterium]